MNQEVKDYYASIDPGGRYICQKCNVPLVKTPVQLRYLHAGFPVEMPGCPVCGMIYISEDLALGKILNVEKALEEK